MKLKHKIFCDNYFLYNDLQKAARLVGYKDSTAKALLKNSDVKNYLLSLEQNIASSNEIMQCLTSIMRGNPDEFLSNTLNNLSSTLDTNSNINNDLYSQALTLISSTSNNLSNLNNKNSKSTVSTREQLKAAELLGKALALFSQKSTDLSLSKDSLYITFLGVDDLLN